MNPDEGKMFDVVIQIENQVSFDHQSRMQNCGDGITTGNETATETEVFSKDGVLLIALVIDAPTTLFSISLRWFSSASIITCSISN